jgi:hypothetical protein
MSFPSVQKRIGLFFFSFLFKNIIEGGFFQDEGTRTKLIFLLGTTKTQKKYRIQVGIFLVTACTHTENARKAW